MKERGLLLGDKWVRALRDGQKTQTRRPIDPGMLSRLTDWGDTKDIASLCRLGMPGDRLYVRECWGYDWAGKVRYRADEGHPRITSWHPSIHLPRSFSRFLLEITEVRAEPVSSISEQDAIAEGCEHIDLDRPPVLVFREGWNEVYGQDYPWAMSWAWAITFKRLKQRRPR
jgi:hypothetical protein